MQLSKEPGRFNDSICAKDQEEVNTVSGGRSLANVSPVWECGPRLSAGRPGSFE